MDRQSYGSPTSRVWVTPPSSESTRLASFHFWRTHGSAAVAFRALDTGAGHKDAEYVIVVMGSGAVTCSETATYLQEKGEKVACQRARGGWS